MPRKKEARYGPYQYYRKQIKRPDGTYESIYGKTIAERDERVRIRLAELAQEAELAADPFVWEYAAKWYARQEPGLTEVRRKHFRSQINKIILPVIGSKRMSEITSDDLEDVLATRRHMSRSAQEKTVQILKAIFHAAYKAEVIKKDVSDDLKAAGKPAPPKRALTPSQEKTLLEAVRGLRGELFCKLALYAGLREQEICALMWDAVDLDAAAPHITVQRAARWPSRSYVEISDMLKSSAAFRTVPIPPVLADALRAERDKLDLPEEKLRARPVMANREGGPLSYSSLQSLWHSVRARSTASGRALGDQITHHAAKVTMDFDCTPHQLRHTYITRLILGGMDLKRVQYLAGHSSPQITIKIYTDLMGNRPEDLIDDVSSIFGA